MSKVFKPDQIVAFIERNPFSEKHKDEFLALEIESKDHELALDLLALSDLPNGNPFLYGKTYNLTQQAKILKEFPEKAERLRRIAEPTHGGYNPFLSGNLTGQIIARANYPEIAEKLAQEARIKNGEAARMVCGAAPTVPSGAGRFL